MLWPETHATVVDILPVTLVCFIRTSYPIDHVSATMLLPNSPTMRHSSTSHSFFQISCPPISFFTFFNSPDFLTHTLPFLLNISGCFRWYWHSTFPGTTVYLSTDRSPCAFSWLSTWGLLIPLFAFRKFRHFSFWVVGLIFCCLPGINYTYMFPEQRADKNSCNLQTCGGGGSSGAASVATPPPRCPCSPPLRAYSSIDKNFLSSWYLDISPVVPPLGPKVSIACSLRGLIPCSGQWAHQDRPCRCVVARHNPCMVPTVAIHAISNLVQWVHSEGGSSLVYMEVDCQHGWYKSRQSGSLHNWGQLHCSSGRYTHWRFLS